MSLFPLRDWLVVDHLSLAMRITALVLNSGSSFSVKWAECLPALQQTRASCLTSSPNLSNVLALCFLATGCCWTPPLWAFKLQNAVPVLTTCGREEPRISRQTPEISAQPARYPPEPLGPQLTCKHLLPTLLYNSLHFDVLQCAPPCDMWGLASLLCPRAE